MSGKDDRDEHSASVRIERMTEAKQRELNYSDSSKGTITIMADRPPPPPPKDQNKEKA